MRVAYPKPNSMGSIYGEKYDDAFFENLWKENLIDKCPDVEFVPIENTEYRRNVEKYADEVDAMIGLWITDDLFSDAFMTKHPRLKYASTLAHGFGRFDKEACRKHGLTITNTVYGDVTIAQFALALLLDICHDIGTNDDYYRNKKWLPENKGKRGMGVTRQIELYEKTFGVLGLGNIGLCAARMAAGFGMKVIAYSRHKKTGPEYDFIEQVSLDELYERSDVISIHCPLTDETRGMVDKQAFEKMKDGVIIINTARGAIIDEDELVRQLNSGKVYAAGLDVLAGEPLQEPAEIMKCKNTRLTEHIAWAPVESRIRSIKIGCQNFINWKEGHPTSVVS